VPLFTDAIANLRGKPIPAPANAADWTSSLSFLREGSIDLADGLTASYKAIYQRQPWVYAAVNKLARSVARMPLKAYERDDAEKRRSFDGRLSDLMHQPYRGGTPFGLKERIVKNTAIYGNAIVVKLGPDDPDAPPDELFPAPATGWSLGEGDYYIWTSKAGDRYPFERRKIIHFRFWDLDETGFGMSMLEPLRMTLAIEDAAQRLGVSAFKMPRPGSVLKTDQKLKPEAAAALKANIQAVHGTVDNAFKVAVLEQGLEWAPWPSTNMTESAVVDHRKLTREEVAAVFDVPQPTIGMLDEANFASVDMLHTMLYQDSLGPWVTMIEETLQAEFVNMIPAFAGQFVEFDLNAVLRGDISSRYRAYSTAISAGFKTPDEIRALENDAPMADQQPEAGMLHFPLNQSSGRVGAQISEDSGATDDSAK
jgi:HK97 family phage portal protein